MRAIGIDLGTTNSVAAVFGPSLRVLSNRDNDALTPSVVSYYLPRERRGEGQFVVGRLAVNNAARDPDNTVFSVKRLMGRKFGEAFRVYGREITLDGLQSRYGYRFAPPPPADATDRDLRVQLGDAGYSPTEVSTMILRQIKEDAEKALGEAVTHAVITVPAYFDGVQRSATVAAGKAAGLEVPELLDEPTAAALAYGLGREAERRVALVFDLGGGTFDISVIQMTGGKYVQRTIQGDNWLGGDDFDQLIAARIRTAAEEQHGLADLRKDRGFMRRAFEAAERAKRTLSGQAEADIDLMGVKTVELGPVEVRLTVTRAEFEADIRPLVDRVREQVRLALEVVPADQITDVLLVGGSTAVPAVQRVVTDLFGDDRVRRTLNPMECVALGAAIKAAAHAPAAGRPADRGPATTVIGRTALQLGITVVEGTNADRFVPIIDKGTPYPLAQPKSKMFRPSRDNQDVLRVMVYEGMNAKASLNEYQGEVLLRLPPGTPATAQVEVTFDYDRNRTLKVRVKLAGQADFVETELQPGQANKPANPSVVDDWREELGPLVRLGKVLSEKYGEFLADAERAALEGSVRAGGKALDQDSPAEGTKAINDLRYKVFMGSGVASKLFLAERMRGNTSLPVSPERMGQLQDKINKVRAAHAAVPRGDTKTAADELQLVLNEVMRDVESVRAKGPMNPDLPRPG